MRSPCYPSLSICVSVSLSLCTRLPPSVYPSLSVCVPVCVSSPYVCVSVSLRLCILLPLPVYPSLSLSLSLYTNSYLRLIKLMRSLALSVSPSTVAKRFVGSPFYLRAPPPNFFHLTCRPSLSEKSRRLFLTRTSCFVVFFFFDSIRWNKHFDKYQKLNTNGAWIKSVLTYGSEP